jgi:hypothetical protein
MNNADHLKQLDSLKSSEERQNFQTLWQPGAEFCNPENSDINTVSGKGQRRRITRITDVGIEARRGFATGMYAWAIGDGEFFRYDVDDRELSKMDEVKRWFSDVNHTTMSYMNASNFPAEVLQQFGELSYIGTSATFTEWYNGGLNFKTQHISQFWIDVDARGMVNKMFVEIPLNASQIIDEFGEENAGDDIRRAAKAGSRDEFCVVQICYKNPNHKPESILPEDREFLSNYVLRKGTLELRVDGYDTFPFAISRLYKAKNEMYGRSCYMECSKSISLNNDQETTIIRGGKNRADPPWVEAADSRTRHIRTNGTSRVIYDASALGGPPVQMDMKNDVGINIEMLGRTDDRVQKAFLMDAFNPLLDQRNMTKAEMNTRMGIGLSKVTPPLNKWHSEYASPLFERVFDILNKKGKYPEMPEVLEGKKFKMTYISKAALALKEMELNSTQALIESTLTVAEADPTILDNINFDESVRLAADAYNVPNSVIRSEKEVKAMRKQRADAQAQQQEIDNAPALADSALKVSQIEGNQQKG